MSAKFLTKKFVLISTIVLLLIAAASVWYYLGGSYSLTGHKNLSSAVSKIEAPSDSDITANKIYPQPLRVYYTEPAAALDKRGIKLEKGIEIRPSIRGEWIWETDTVLRFMPENDWIPDTEYKVTLPSDIFNPQITIKDKSFTFSSPRFMGSVSNAEFYEDPQNIKNKSAVAEFRFNYPLDPQDIKNKISVRTVNGEKYDFTYKLTDLDTRLHVISAPLKIANEENFAKITVSGVENAYNKKALKDKLVATVKIPGSSTFIKLASIKSEIIRNEQKNNNPEQIVLLTFTTAVKSEEVKRNFTLWYSDMSCDNLKKQVAAAAKFSDIRNINALDVKEVSYSDKAQKTHMFKYDKNKTNGCLIAKVNKGLSSAEGFLLGEDIVQTFDISPYPLEAQIAFSGSIMSLQGSREVAFLSRGVKKLKASVAQIDTAELNHLVTQTSGDFSHPYFYNYNFTENNIAEVFEKTLQINSQHPSEANYSSLNLDEYFKNKKGIFLLKIRGYQDDYHTSPEDSRLIVLTDLGIVVKDNLNKTHDVFISNVSEGRPVDGATVDVLGKNGIPVLTVSTGTDGHAIIPDFSDFKNDKEPVVYKISKGNDVSFLPINRSDRRLNFSRFDVGGEYTYGNDQYALKGCIFSDRGIYRPGEDGHIGMIVRQNDLNVPQHLPFVLEMRNPSGDIVSNARLWADAVGFMEHEFQLDRAAPTGIYNVSLYVLDKKNTRIYVADTRIKVEEFQPDNLRIKANWQQKNAKGWMTYTDLTADVSLYNLYGNPASEHEIKASYSLTPADFRFKEYDGYLFRDPLRSAEKQPRSYQSELPAVKTNTSGTGNFKLDLAQFEQGTYNLRLIIEGLELGGGRSVSTSLGALVSPNKYLIGWKADGRLDYINKNAERQISFVAINNNLETIGKDELFMSFARRHYVSGLVEMPNGTYRYQMIPQEQIILKQPWQIPVNGTTQKLMTSEPGEYILSIEDKDGRLLARIEYNVAGAANLSHAIDKDASLGLKLNRSEYNHGDEIEMQITAPYSGYGLITIEQDDVYAYKWFKTETASVVEKIKLPDTVEGNAYINVAFFRDINSREIYMPSMSYAAAPFAINKSARRLDVELSVPQVIKPGEDLTIEYKTSAKAQIVLYGVNQGILQVARYQMPNPLEEFLKKKALRVVTSQIMDLIMPDIRILRMLMSSGGDDSYEQDALDKNLNPFARRVDKPVAFWSGILSTDEHGGTYTYKVPETFNGEIKIMAVAVSDSRFGSATQKVLSLGDFALIPSGPLNVAPGDEFVIGLSVGNLVENSGNDYEVRVTLDAGDGFSIVGEAVQNVKLSEQGEALLKYRLKALSDIGAKEMVFTAESVTDNSKKSRMPYTVSLRPSNPYSSSFAMGFERSEYTLDGVEDLYKTFRVQQLSASASPMVLASGLLKYLDKFPHFCTEQSVSKIFPAAEVFFKSPELIKNVDVYNLFNDIMLKLRIRQTLNGGFSTWSVSGAPADPYDSVYTAHFLVKAKEHNFNVPENMLQRVMAYCEEQAARRPDGISDFVPAYAIYVLTVNGKVTTNYLLNLEEYYKQNYKKTWKNSLSASLMAASYKLLQNESKAHNLMGQYKNSDLLADNAMNIYLMATHFPEEFKTLGRESVESLLKPLSSGNFTTVSAAWSVLALNAFDEAEKDKNIKFSNQEPQYTPFPTVDFTPQTKDLRITSVSPFYYVVAQQGFLKTEKVTPRAEGLEVMKVYYDKDGNKISQASLGDELTVKVSYRGLQNEEISDVAIVDMLPGGVEVISDSLKTAWNTEFSEIREDRVLVYAVADRESRDFTYRVKVIAEGSFIVPPVFGSALYMPLVRANSASGMMQFSE